MSSSSQYPSQLLENAVGHISHLPGIGRKTALRLVLHMLRQDPNEVHELTSAIDSLVEDIHYCHVCHNISDTDTCSICADKSRNHKQVCVVENVRDVMAIESTHQYGGIYHVLGGVISPMEGVGPDDLTIDSLHDKVASKAVDEVILALSTTMEGDTTNYYIYKRIAPYGIKITTIARGIAVGDELEYADSLTLGRSIVNRIPFDTTLNY